MVPLRVKHPVFTIECMECDSDFRYKNIPIYLSTTTSLILLNQYKIMLLIS